jgi:hypothetical protein
MFPNDQDERSDVYQVGLSIGFVYNPGKLKRDQIRRLNAALYTLKLPSEQAVSELPVDSTLTEEKGDLYYIQKQKEIKKLAEK